MSRLTKNELKELIELKLAKTFGVRYDEASETMMYRALSLVVKDRITQKRIEFKSKVRSQPFIQHRIA